MASPTWRIEIHKHLGAEFWANDYLTDDPTIEDAQDLAALLLTFEQDIHMVGVTFDYVLVTSYGSGRAFRHIVINEPGNASNLAYIPLFNTLRVDFGTASADPARKYYRIPVAEENQNAGIFETTYLGSIATIINTDLTTPAVYSHIVTPTGHKTINAVAQPLVQMRQLHRRRKKKVTP